MSRDNSEGESPTWRKARRSMGNGNCVEIAPSGAGIAVRDSKDPEGAVLLYASLAWKAFVDSARSNSGFTRF